MASTTLMMTTTEAISFFFYAVLIVNFLVFLMYVFWKHRSKDDLV